MNKRITIFLTVITLLMVSSFVEVSAFRIRIEINNGTWIEKTQSCNWNSNDFCSITITIDLSIQSNTTPDLILLGDAEIVNDRLNIRYDKDPYSEDALRMIGRKKFTIHEDTQVSLTPELIGTTRFSHIVLKRGTYSIGGNNIKRTSIKFTPKD